MQISRRDFLKGVGIGVGSSLIATSIKNDVVHAETRNKPDVNQAKAMLYDSSKCVGCRACQTACHRWNQLPGESYGYGNIYDNPQSLSAQTWTLIKAEGIKYNGKEDLILCKYQCMHCTDAACVKVCPSKALTYHPLGFIAYDQNKCTGCGYCSQFCPFNVPRLGGNMVTGLQKMGKCTFCQDRVPDGRQTACAEACPADAILFGNRVELIAEGKKRVNQIKDKYPNAQLYGENELGGLHVLYVLKDSPQIYNFPTNPQVPMTSYVWKDIIQPLGLAVAGLTIIGLGLNYFAAKKSLSSEENTANMEDK